MKKTAFLINTSRGGVIDEKALIACLENKGLAGAALDVMEAEPLRGSPLQQMSNVVLTPHIASYTRESFNNMGAIVHDVLRVLRNEPPQHRVV
jgi:phosphoglycerate dehydrogenase-like enzyme